MKVGLDYVTLQTLNDSQFLNDKTQTAQSQGASKTSITKTVPSPETQPIEIYRDSYGLSTLAQMSEGEFRAFERATVSMAPNEKIRAAQALHLVSKSYQEAQKKLYEGDQAALLPKEGKGYFKNNPDMLDKGIEVLGQIDNAQGRTLTNFLTRYRSALVTPELNVLV